MSLGVRQCTFTQTVSLGPLQVTGPLVRQPPPPNQALHDGAGSLAACLGGGSVSRTPSGLEDLISEPSDLMIPNFLLKAMAMRNLCDHSQMMSASSLRNLKVREVTVHERVRVFSRPSDCIHPGIT